MSRYAELRAEADRLFAEAEKMRVQEKGEALAYIRDAVVKYSITPLDIFGKPRKPRGRPALRKKAR